MEIEFRVRIIPEEKKQQLYASSLFALSGLLLSIFLSLFIPILSGFLIGGGCFLAYLAFRPFLKIREQEKIPDRLSISHQRLILFSKNKKAVSIPLSAIQKVTYEDGIVIHLKKPVREQIEIVDSRFLKNKKNGDFFFEWFEPNVFSMINQELKN